MCQIFINIDNFKEFPSEFSMIGSFYFFVIYFLYNFYYRDENLVECLKNIISETNININADANVVVGMDTR